MIVTYLLRRVLYGFATVLGVLLLLFVLFFLVTTPDDIARRALGEKAPPEALAQWKVNHGYDKPRIWNPEAPTDTMLAEHFKRMLTFNFGNSSFAFASKTRRRSSSLSQEMPSMTGFRSSSMRPLLGSRADPEPGVSVPKRQRSVPIIRSKKSIDSSL